MAVVYHLSRWDLVGVAEYMTFQEQAYIDHPEVPLLRLAEPVQRQHCMGCEQRKAVEPCAWHVEGKDGAVEEAAILAGEVVVEVNQILLHARLTPSPAISAECVVELLGKL